MSKSLAVPIVRARPAVPRSSSVRLGYGHHAADLCSEWMVLPDPEFDRATGPVTSDYDAASCVTSRGRACTDSSAEQHDGACLPRCSVKLPRGKLMSGSLAYADGPQTGSCRAVRFEPHADAIALVGWPTRKRVAAEERARRSHQVEGAAPRLAREGCLQRVPLGVLQRQRDHVVAFPIDGRHAQPIEILLPPDAPRRLASSPALPLLVAVSGGRSSASNDERQPDDSASILSARSNRSRG